MVKTTAVKLQQQLSGQEYSLQQRQQEKKSSNGCSNCSSNSMDSNRRRT